MVSLTIRTAQQGTLQAAILGSDLVLASLPAEPVQIIHAAQALGFDVVVPASWGDELIAAGVLDELASRPPGPSILCACPNARRRIMAPGGELAPFLINTVSPPVAAARYLRAVHGSSPLLITFVGSCPGAQDESIDENLSPAQFLDLCAERGIVPVDQPRVFESTIPVDRRRHFSLPGGLPTVDAVALAQPGTDVISLDAGNVAFDIAQTIISGRVAILDTAPAVGCPCSGFVPNSDWSNGRAALLAHEPPRSATPVIDSRIDVELDLPGHGPLAPSFEENVPLSVVVGADLSRREAARPNAPQLDRVVSAEAPQPEVDLADDVYLAGAVREIESVWVDLAARSEPSSAEPASAEEEHPPQRVGATPAGAPAVRTPSGPLPRAYLMVRRGLRPSGEHTALASGSHATVRDGEGMAGNQSVEFRDEPAVAAPTPSPDDKREPRGTVDAVLDILSKAIRDVVP
jgi:hypothetical protein